MVIGSQTNRKDKPLGIAWPSQPHRFLEVFISYDEQLCQNFDDRLEKCKKVLNSWKERNLTLIGKTQIIKTFIIAQFLYTLSTIKMPEDCITKLETVISNFIWSGGRPKLKSSILKQTLHKGGLNIPDVQCMIKANRIMWIKKLKLSADYFWKQCFSTFISDCGINQHHLLLSNYSLQSLMS
jgi:hypothetical protein